MPRKRDRPTRPDDESKARPAWSERLREFRESTRLSQAEASVFSGVSLTTLQRWEQGIGPEPRLSKVEPLARLYGHAAAHVFMPEDPPPADFRFVDAYHLWVHPHAGVATDISDAQQKEVASWNDSHRRRSRGRQPVSTGPPR